MCRDVQRISIPPLFLSSSLSLFLSFFQVQLQNSLNQQSVKKSLRNCSNLHPSTKIQQFCSFLLDGFNVASGSVLNVPFPASFCLLATAERPSNYLSCSSSSVGRDLQRACRQSHKALYNRNLRLQSRSDYKFARITTLEC